nr:ferredoxin-thioredoxin reductase catalytic chain, chloroplastic [Ipomoea batatas]
MLAEYKRDILPGRRRGWKRRSWTATGSGQRRSWTATGSGRRQNSEGSGLRQQCWTARSGDRRERQQGVKRGVRDGDGSEWRQGTLLDLWRRGATARHYLPSQAASIPYNLGFGIPSLATTPSSRPSYAQRRHVVFAKVEREPSKQFVEMRKFLEQHTWKSGTYFCIDKGVIAAVIKRLVEHKDSLGAPFCPCRHYDDKPTEVQQGFCNCPYHPMYLKNRRSRMVLAAAVVVAGEGFRRCGIGHVQWCGIDRGRQFMMKAMEGMVQAVVASAASSLSDFQDELSDQKLWNESIWIRSSVDFLAVDGTEAFRNFQKWWWSKLLGGWRSKLPSKTVAEKTSWRLA